MNWRLMLGLFAVVSSLIVGKITTVLFVIYFNDPMMRYLMIAIYIISWPIIIFGAYVCGVEGADYIRRIYQYFSYKYYHERIKRQIQERRKNLKDVFNKYDR